MLDALVHRQDGNEAGAAEATVIEQGLVAAHDRGRAVALRDHPVDEVRTGQVQAGARDAAALIGKQAVGFCAQQFYDVGHDVCSLVNAQARFPLGDWT